MSRIRTILEQIQNPEGLYEAGNNIRQTRKPFRIGDILENEECTFKILDILIRAFPHVDLDLKYQWKLKDGSKSGIEEQSIGNFIHSYFS